MIEHADAPRMMGHMSDHNLRLDANGNPHVAYGSNHLYYAWNVGSECHIQTVIEDDSNSSIALDSDGAPHIRYSGGNGYQKYASYDPEKEAPTPTPPTESTPTEATLTTTHKPGDSKKLSLPQTMRN